MATKASGARGRNTNSSNSGSSNNSWIPPPVVPVSQPVERDLGFKYLGWLAACVLVAILLPLTGLLYSKLYETKIEVQQAINELEKLKKEIDNQRSKDVKNP